MKKMTLIASLLSLTPVQAEQEFVCVDKQTVEQVVNSLNHITAALTVLAQKIQQLSDQDTPSRTVNFDAWKEMVDQSKPTKESNPDKK